MTGKLLRRLCALIMALAMLTGSLALANEVEDAAPEPATKEIEQLAPASAGVAQGGVDEADDAGEIMPESNADTAADIMPVIYNPDCKHENTEPYSALERYELIDVDDYQHTFMGQRITGRKCRDCGAFTEYVAGGFEPMPPEEHHFYHTGDESYHGEEVIICACGYECNHPNGISYRWENIPKEELEIDEYDYNEYSCQYVSPTQHKKPVSGRRYIATIDCKICGSYESYTLTSELNYELTSHTFAVDGGDNHEHYCYGCLQYIYEGVCPEGGYHDFQLSYTYTNCDTYTYVSKDICHGKGIQRWDKYECSKCGSEGNTIESYDPNATQDYPHDHLGYTEWNGVCYQCGSLIECDHEFMSVVDCVYSDVISSLGPIINNGDGTHSGKMIETVYKWCPECAYSSSERRVVDGTQPCEFKEYEVEAGVPWVIETVVQCKGCGAINRPIYLYDGQFYCPHGGGSVVSETYSGGGYPPQPEDLRSHTYPYTMKVTTHYCPICGYWDDEEKIDETFTEPHDYGIFWDYKYRYYVQ